MHRFALTIARTLAPLRLRLRRVRAEPSRRQKSRASRLDAPGRVARRSWEALHPPRKKKVAGKMSQAACFYVSSARRCSERVPRRARGTRASA